MEYHQYILFSEQNYIVNKDGQIVPMLFADQAVKASIEKTHMLAWRHKIIQQNSQSVPWWTAEEKFLVAAVRFIILEAKGRMQPAAYSIP